MNETAVCAQMSLRASKLTSLTISAGGYFPIVIESADLPISMGASMYNAEISFPTEKVEIFLST